MEYLNALGARGAALGVEKKDNFFVDWVRYPNEPNDPKKP